MILSDENTWAFGQAVTMALLAIPIFGFSGNSLHDLFQTIQLTKYLEALFTPPDKSYCVYTPNVKTTYLQMYQKPKEQPRHIHR
jgi:hypothetical protein